MKETAFSPSLILRPGPTLAIFRDNPPCKRGAIALALSLAVILASTSLTASLFDVPHVFSVALCVSGAFSAAASVLIHAFLAAALLRIFRRGGTLRGLLAFECFLQAFCAAAVCFVLLGWFFVCAIGGWRTSWMVTPTLAVAAFLAVFSLGVLIWRVSAIRVIARVRMAAAILMLVVLLPPSLAATLLAGRALEEYLFLPFDVSRGAMIPTLVGKHKRVRCRKCRFKFAFDPRKTLAICPNCSSLQETTSLGEASGDRILVSRAFRKWGASPRRWELAMLESPLVELRCSDCGYAQSDVQEDAEGACPRCNSTRVVKRRRRFVRRVVGLPGDEVVIRRGDIYINGAIARKPTEIQENIWTLIHDSSLASPEMMAWAWESGEGGWSIGARGGLHVSSNWTRDLETHIRYKAVIFDQSAYDGCSGGNVVGDLRIAFDFTLQSRRGSVVAVLREGRDVFAVYLKARREDAEARIERRGETLKTARTHRISTGRHHVDFSNVDDRLTFTLDSREIFNHKYASPTDEDDSLTESGVEIGVVGATAGFRNIRIFRDVHYTSAGWMRDANAVVLGADEYFVLADNSLSNEDSRFWGPVPKENLIGEAVFRYWPLHRVGKVK